MLSLVEGRIARSRGELDRSRRLLRDGLETSRGTSYVGTEARLLIELAGLEFEAGNAETAEDRARATMALVRAGLGDDDSQWRARIVLARLARERRDRDDAELQLEDVIEAVGSGPTTDTGRVAHTELALLQIEAGDLEAAVASVEAAEQGVETVRVLLQVALARSRLMAAQGARGAARDRMAAVLDRYPQAPVAQRRQAEALIAQLST